MAEYQIASLVPKAAKEKLVKYSELTAQLLFNRGIKSEAEADRFLAPDYETELYDPMLLHDIEAAMARIKAAFENDEHIVIFSDYDCDGIPGGVVLYDFFTAIGITNFSNYIPHRHFEGFGLSVEAVEKLAGSSDKAPKLIITIDCGMGDSEAVDRAKELGIDVIVTDHHEPGADLPKAIAVVNPKLGSYPYQDLCGAGVVFKLVQALLATGGFDLAPGQEKWWLDMVGVATIADMVPLTGENRTLAKYGLTVLRKSRRPGLQQLFRKVRINQRYLTEDDIGFTIGPRINAASRMDTPEDAFFVLASSDEGEAGARVDHLEKLNQERKTAIALITRELHQRLEEFSELPPVIALGNPNWRPALVGLAANKLAEEHNRPVFLWGRDGKHKHKGSCRSGGGISVVKVMEAGQALFSEFGGHHMSGGFTLVDDAVFDFSNQMVEAYERLGDEAVVKELQTIDATLRLQDDLWQVVKELRELAPFGMGNPKPLFRFEAVVPKNVEQFGKGKEHLKLRFEGSQIEAMTFFATPQSFTKVPIVGSPCTLIAHVEESYFMNRQQLRLRIVDTI